MSALETRPLPNAQTPTSATEPAIGPGPWEWWVSVVKIYDEAGVAMGSTVLTSENACAPGRIRTCAPASGGQCSIP